MKPKTITVEMIRSWDPCYDPVDGKSKLPEDWTGTVLDILDLKITTEDKIWVVCRNELVSEKLMRLFAVWCARQVQHLLKDERPLKALDVAEAYANGNATKEELAAARATARDAAWAAAGDAAGAAAGAAAWDAAWAAAGDAAGAAARDAARSAAWDAARDAQERKLRDMLIAGIETGDVVCEESGVRGERER